MFLLYLELSRCLSLSNSAPSAASPLFISVASPIPLLRSDLLTVRLLRSSNTPFSSISGVEVIEQSEVEVTERGRGRGHRTRSRSRSQRQSEVEVTEQRTSTYRSRRLHQSRPPCVFSPARVMDSLNLTYHAKMKRKAVVTMIMFTLSAVISVLFRHLFRNKRPRLLPNQPIADHATSIQNAPHTGFSVNGEALSTNISVGTKRKRRNENVTEKIVSEMHNLGILLAKSMTATVIDGIQEKLPYLDGALRSLDGITREEIGKSHLMFAKNRDLVLVFFGVELVDRLEWLRTLLPSFAY